MAKVPASPQPLGTVSVQLLDRERRPLRRIRMRRSDLDFRIVDAGQHFERVEPNVYVQV